MSHQILQLFFQLIALSPNNNVKYKKNNIQFKRHTPLLTGSEHQTVIVIDTIEELESHL